MKDFKRFIFEGEGKYKGETWEDGYKRRVVKTTDPEHKEQGYKWRIKGKERDEISIKLYKDKPDFAVASYPIFCRTEIAMQEKENNA